MTKSHKTDTSKTPGRFLRPEVVELVITGELDWNEACLLALIEQVVGRNGSCFMSNKYLAQQMRLSPRRIRLMLEKLERLRLIERQQGNQRRILSEHRAKNKDSGHT